MSSREAIDLKAIMLLDTLCVIDHTLKTSLETVQVITPPSILSGDVVVAVTDNDGVRVELAQKYKYINTDSINSDRPNDNSGSTSNGADSSNDENIDDDNKDNKDNESDDSSNSSSGGDNSDQPDEGNIGDEQLNIEAPNAGANL